MPLKLFSPKISSDFVVVDPNFPQKEPFAFRNIEINEYLSRFENFQTYTMHPMQPDSDAWFDHGYGTSEAQFLENKQGYLRYHPENKSRLHYLHPGKNYSFRLAYSYFLAETYTLLPYYEKNHIPFVFVLYPGGSFGLDNYASDLMLKKIFVSLFFRGVIVTQRLTYDYLLTKNLCPKDKVHFIYGGFVQFKPGDLKPKKHFPTNKKTFDICFVAAKYSEKGLDKGYDLFIETAKLLCQETDNIMFHVVGGFDQNEIDISTIESRIKFYGYKRPDFLLGLYANMDIFLAPNRPFKLYEGNFDGFPLGIDAGYCGVALFVADELGMNDCYQVDKEIFIIPLDAKIIADKVMTQYQNPKKFYELSRLGQARTQQLFDINEQIDARIKVFSQFVNLRMSA